MDPLGARRCFPQVLATSRTGPCKEIRSTRPNGCDGEDLIDVGQNVMGPSTSLGQSARREAILPAPNDELDPRKQVVLGNMLLQGVHMTEGPETERNVSPTTVSPHGEDRSTGGAYNRTDAKRTSQISGHGVAPDTKSAQTTASSAVLELGAGTGVCGMAASLSLGCTVT